MTKEKLKTIGIWNLLAVVVILIFCIVHNEISFKNIEPQIVTVHDTTIVTKEVIKEKEKIKYVTKYDTLYVYHTDSIRDTIRIGIPIEHKQYTDTFITDTSKTVLDIRYSGYKAELDGVYVHSSFTQKERIKIKTSGFGQYLGIGLQVGYGATINTIDKTFVPGPYIGVGISVGWCYKW